jgi:hypothetical protein
VGGAGLPVVERRELPAMALDREPHLAELEHGLPEETGEFGRMGTGLCLDGFPLNGPGG